MVNEFNKIIGDVLAAEGEVCLPGQGSLVVVRRAAERISSRRLRRSCNAVMFVDGEHGRSVVDVVAEVCGTDAAEAREIYDRWRSKSTADGVLAIDGVGHISHRRFFVAESFDRILNPNGHRVVELVMNRRGAALRYLLYAAAVVAVLAGAAWWSGLYERRYEIMTAVAEWFDPQDMPLPEMQTAADFDNYMAEQADAEYEADDEPIADDAGQSGGLPEDSGPTVPPEQQTEPDIQPEQQAEPDPDPSSEHAAATGVREPQPQDAGTTQQEQPLPQDADASQSRVSRHPQQIMNQGIEMPQQEQPQADSIGRMTSGRKYVVYGVFSTPENVLRAVGEVRARGVPECSAFVYGAKYMVAIYSSDSEADCNTFIRNVKQFNNLWVYTAH